MSYETKTINGVLMCRMDDRERFMPCTAAQLNEKILAQRLEIEALREELQR